jgi:hypothetical protein
VGVVVKKKVEESRVQARVDAAPHLDSFLDQLERLDPGDSTCLNSELFPRFMADQPRIPQLNSVAAHTPLFPPSHQFTLRFCSLRGCGRGDEQAHVLPLDHRAFRTLSIEVYITICPCTCFLSRLT